MEFISDILKEIFSSRMSLQWFLVSSVLYVEIFCVFLLLMPFVSAIRWHYIFKSKLFHKIDKRSRLYFNLFLGLLILLFIDSIRDIHRFSLTMEEKADMRNNPLKEVEVQARLFRAQRNLYISGFALFLFMVLGRLVSLLHQQGEADLATEEKERKAEEELEVQKEAYKKKDLDFEALKKQAESTNREFDRVTEEVAKLQEKLKEYEGKGESKKDS